MVRAAPGCCGVVRGSTTIQSVCCPRIAAPTRLAFATTTSGFVVCWWACRLGRFGDGLPFVLLLFFPLLFPVAAQRRKFLVFWQGLEPAPNHAPDFIQPLGNEEQLLGADPAAVADEPPEDAKFFEVQIHAAERGVTRRNVRLRKEGRKYEQRSVSLSAARSGGEGRGEEALRNRRIIRSCLAAPLPNPLPVRASRGEGDGAVGGRCGRPSPWRAAFTPLHHSNATPRSHTSRRSALKRQECRAPAAW